MPWLPRPDLSLSVRSGRGAANLLLDSDEKETKTRKSMVKRPDLRCFVRVAEK